MVKFNKLFVISGDAYSYYFRVISKNDVVITTSRNVYKSVSKISGKVILVEKDFGSSDSRSDKVSLISKHLMTIDENYLTGIDMAVFQEDFELGNLLVPLIHKTVPISAPFLVEYKRLTSDTYALLKEVTLMGTERNIYVLNRHTAPSSSKLRRILLEAIIEDKEKHSHGVYTVSIKRYKSWDKLREWLEKAKQTTEKIGKTRLPDNYQPYIQSLKSRIREASFYIDGTKFTKPLQELNEKSYKELEPLTEFRLKEDGGIYCFRSKRLRSNIENCFELDYLDNEVIYLAFPRLEPVFPYETEHDELSHAMRLYDKIVSSKGYGYLHPFDPNEITVTNKYNINSWKNVILFLTDYTEVHRFLDKIKSTLTPLIVLKDVVDKCEDTFQCDKSFNASKDELKKILSEPLSKYSKLVDEYISVYKVSGQPDSETIRKFENNLATLIISITDDDFLEFITKNYDKILELLVKVSQIT